MKTRIETRTRHVPMTIGGVTHMVPEEYQVVLPVPPRDWDQAAAIILNVFTFFAIIASLFWTTTAVGGLLDRHAPAFSSYMAAAVFDVAWIGCMLAEWMARHNPDKAKPAGTGSYIALIISMIAVAYSGYVNGSTFTGLMEASVSPAAKGLWFIATNYHKVELDPQHQAWTQARAQDIGARKVLAHLNRQDARTRDQLAAFVAAQAASQATAYTVSQDPDSDSAKTRTRGRRRTDADSVLDVSMSVPEVCPDVLAGQSGVPESVPPTVPHTVPASKTSGSRSKRDQILVAADMLPSDATNVQIAELLSSQGISVSPKYVYNTLRNTPQNRVRPTDGTPVENSQAATQEPLPTAVHDDRHGGPHPGYL